MYAGMKKNDRTNKDVVKTTEEWMREVIAREEKNPLNMPPIRPFAESFKTRDEQQQKALYDQMFVQGNARRVEEYVAGIPKNRKAIIMGGLWRDRGGALFKQGKLDEAIEAWKISIRNSLSEDTSSDLPHQQALIVMATDVELDEYGDFIACANNIAQCYIKQNKLSEALDWLEECRCLHKSWGNNKKPSSLPWSVLLLPVQEFIILFVKMLMRQEHVFTELGNTSAAYAAVYNAFKHRNNFLTDTNILKEEVNGTWSTYVKMRHPDPQNVDGLKIVDPALQIRGVWKKIRVPSTTPCPPPRVGPTVAVYEGRLYMFGGEHETGKALMDGWVLDLHDMDGWHPIAGPPPRTPAIYHQPLIVYEDKGYLFQGQETLRIFDFKTETWSEVTTKLRNQTPWRKFMPRNYLIAYAAHLYKGTIYVFGGREEWGEYGRNIMMALDLKTLQWDIISGTIEVKGDVTHPGPRGYACSWIVGDKFYVTLGSAKRADMGPDADHTYFDLWSFDLKSHKWTSQKMWGNAPSPRTQAAYTYNQTWNKSIIFGGYHGDMMFTPPGGNELTRFAYYADTFIWCPEANRWSHVLTKGFPTYRSCAELFTDPSSGKTYLFGGLMNTQFVPSRKSTMAKILNDIWELVIDVPNSGFEESDFEDPDPRFSKLGPWVRCYQCHSVGRWMVCTGSCRKTPQAASFCSKDCQVTAWPRHKADCRKL